MPAGYAVDAFHISVATGSGARRRKKVIEAPSGISDPVARYGAGEVHRNGRIAQETCGFLVP